MDDTREERRKGRTLSDADVDAIAQANLQLWTEQFYRNVGQGVWRLAWKAILLGLLMLAVYGAAGNWGAK